MNSQDHNQKILFFVIIACLVFAIVLWHRNYNHEDFSPYRGTGGIYSNYTGYKYLDDYTDKDIYQYNPWIYPSFSYDKLLFKYERENNEYLEKKRKIMLDNLRNVPE